MGCVLLGVIADADGFAGYIEFYWSFGRFCCTSGRLSLFFSFLPHSFFSFVHVALYDIVEWIDREDDT